MNGIQLQRHRKYSNEDGKILEILKTEWELQREVFAASYKNNNSSLIICLNWIIGWNATHSVEVAWSDRIQIYTFEEDEKIKSLLEKESQIYLFLSNKAELIGVSSLKKGKNIYEKYLQYKLGREEAK